MGTSSSSVCNCALVCSEQLCSVCWQRFQAEAKARARAPSSTSLLHLPVSLQQASMVWNLGLKITNWLFLSNPSVLAASPATSVLTVSRKDIGRTTARTVSGMAGRWLTGTSSCSRSSEIFLAPDSSIRAQELDGRLSVRLMVVHRASSDLFFVGHLGFFLVLTLVIVYFFRSVFILFSVRMEPFIVCFVWPCCACLAIPGRTTTDLPGDNAPCLNDCYSSVYCCHKILHYQKSIKAEVEP